MCSAEGSLCGKRTSERNHQAEEMSSSLLFEILCYVALSIVTLIVASVNIQLLRLGLVNIMTDGETYLKERLDPFVLSAMIVSSLECLVCLFSLAVGIRLSYDAAHRKFRKKEGAFFVQILSEKEIVLVSKAPSSKQSGSTESID